MSNQYTSVFDIIGPVMIGPSSSHTAGAARIGKIVRKIFGEQPDSVDFHLFESFAKTYKGHGTDIALVGGLLGMEPDDERLADSLKIAHEANMEVLFTPTNDRAEHPNTVRIHVKKGTHKLSVTGVSIGGGSIQISEINGFKLHLSMSIPTYLVVHQDEPGIISQVTSVFSRHHLNIGMMTMTRESKGQKAIMVLEVDSKEKNKEVIEEIQKVNEIYSASFFF